MYVDTTSKMDKCLSETIFYEEHFTSRQIASEPSINIITYFSDFQIVLLGRDSTFLFGEPYYQLSNKTYLFPRITYLMLNFKKIDLRLNGMCRKNFEVNGLKKTQVKRDETGLHLPISLHLSNSRSLYFYVPP
jgi:hypothetical protein